MATGTLVSLDEYLSTIYEPDCEYVDGELIERNVGEFDHSGVQGLIYAMLLRQKRKAGIHVFVEFAGSGRGETISDTGHNGDQAQGQGTNPS